LPMGPGFDPQTGQMRQPWTVYSEAQQLFDLRPLDQTAPKIDPDVSVLVLVHPKDLSPATQFAIDQYALRGGHLLVFVDPLAQADQSGEEGRNPMAAMGADKSSHLKSLLEAWGVQFDPGEVIADRGYALTVSTRSGEPVEHLGFLGLGKDAFTTDDVITAGLSNVNVASAGYLEPLKDAKVRFEPLLQASADAEPLPVPRFRMLFDPATLRDGFKPTGRRYNIAARLSGNVHISVRGRASYRRPFERVEKLQRAAQDRFRVKAQQLEQQLRDTEDKLTALRSKGGKQASLIITPEQEREIEHFQTEKLRIRKELRAVRAGLDADIERLGTELKLLNIVVAPLLFTAVALLVAAWRRGRRGAR